jgi:hypothetical protein
MGRPGSRQRADGQGGMGIPPATSSCQPTSSRSFFLSPYQIECLTTLSYTKYLTPSAELGHVGTARGAAQARQQRDKQKLHTPRPCQIRAAEHEPGAGVTVRPTSWSSGSRSTLFSGSFPACGASGGGPRVAFRRLTAGPAFTVEAAGFFASARTSFAYIAAQRRDTLGDCFYLGTGNWIALGREDIR